MAARDQVTLGIIAGGRGTRLGGRDKAWLVRDGVPQVVRIARHFEGACGAVLVSANANASRYIEHGLHSVPDRIAGIGPLGALDALAAAATTPWLLSLPVDLVELPERLLETLADAGGEGAVAMDDDGVQPLVALYRLDSLRSALAASIDAGDYSVQAMQARIGLPGLHFDGRRFGNLNTPDDLRLAGYGDG